jgi:hypothetical protein
VRRVIIDVVDKARPEEKDPPRSDLLRRGASMAGSVSRGMAPGRVHGERAGVAFALLTQVELLSEEATAHVRADD